METLLLALQVSQHALGGVVEVHEGAKSVLLPCDFYYGLPPDDPHFMWTREDLSPKSVHLQRAEKDDLTEQNQRFRGRTAMNPDARTTRNFSLTLMNPQQSDSGGYTCSISDGTLELELAEVQLKVKANEGAEVGATEGAESVLLPCRAAAGLPTGTTVEWTLSDPPRVVHVFPKLNQKQDDVYRNRTEMKEDLLSTGDLSLTLRLPTARDSGSYVCTIHTGPDILRQRVELQVKAPFPVWIPVVSVLVAVLVAVLVTGGLLYHFYFREVVKEVDSGVESVLLPSRALFHQRKGTKVEWTDDDGRKLHVSEIGSDKPTEQDLPYRNRTQMEKNLDLILKHPTYKDKGLYTCRVYTKNGNVLMRKRVVLIVRVPQVEVDSGAESVLLPSRALFHQFKATKVEWTGEHGRKLHVSEIGSDRPAEQDPSYRNRIQIKKNCDLILKHPTDKDKGLYTCRVYNKDGNVLMKKQVKLKVRVPQVEVDSGAESVRLPCKASVQLPKDARVEWKDNFGMKVHVSEIGSDGPAEQDLSYRNRTQMEKNCDLILKHPTYKDKGLYTCSIYNKDGKVLMSKDVVLIVKVPQVEVDYEVESALLPCKASVQLPKDAKVEWRDDKNTVMHVYQNGSNRPDQQHQYYRNRTRMKEDPLGTGDLSLTVDKPKYSDILTCSVYNREGYVLMRKEVELIVRVNQVEKEEGAESVVLPFKTTPDLPEDTRIVWERVEPQVMRVYKYQKGSNLTDQQDEFYRNRTKMDEDPLGTGNISLTLDQPTVRDSGEYRCWVENSRVRRQINIQLRVTGRDLVQDPAEQTNQNPLMAEESV
ncbi:immunoglobulin superfamily member 10-like [Menidia menidia]